MKLVRKNAVFFGNRGTTTPRHVYPDNTPEKYAFVRIGIYDGKSGELIEQTDLRMRVPCHMFHVCGYLFVEGFCCHDLSVGFRHVLFFSEEWENTKDLGRKVSKQVQRMEVYKETCKPGLPIED